MLKGLIPLHTLLGVLSCVAQPDSLRLVPVPPRHKTTARSFGDPPILLPTLLKPPSTITNTASPKGGYPWTARRLEKTLRSPARQYGPTVTSYVRSARHGPSHRPPTGQSLIGRPLYGPRKEEAAFAGGSRLYALSK